MTELIEAVKNNNLICVRNLLAQDLKLINKTDKEGKTALHHAVLNENLEMMEFLFAKEANVNLSDKGALTPLHDAAKKCNVKIIDALLRFNAEPNCRNMFGEKPVHFIAQNGNADAIGMLLSWKMDIKAVDNQGKTPLMHAYWHGNFLAAISLRKLLGENEHNIAEISGKDSGEVGLAELAVVFGGEIFKDLKIDERIFRYDSSSRGMQTRNKHMLNWLLYNLTKYLTDSNLNQESAAKICFATNELITTYYDDMPPVVAELYQAIQKTPKYFAVTSETHFTAARLELYKEDPSKIKFTLYDRSAYWQYRGYLRDKKVYCVQYILFDNKLETLQKIIDLLVSIQKAEFDSATDRIFEGLPSIAGSKFIYEEDFRQRPPKVGICYHADTKVLLTALFIEEFGLKKGMAHYKDFTLFYRTQTLHEFVLKDNDSEKEKANDCCIKALQVKKLKFFNSYVKDLERDKDADCLSHSLPEGTCRMQNS